MGSNRKCRKFQEIYVKRFDAKEIFPTLLSGKFKFPIAEGDLRQPGESTKQTKRRLSKKVKEDEEEEELDDKGDSVDKSAEGTTESDARGDSQQAKDFWTMNPDVLVRHHVEPRTKLLSPLDPAVKPPIPLKFIDVTRVTHTDLLEKAEAEIQDVWWSEEQSDEAKCLSDPWIGKTTFWSSQTEAAYRTSVG